MDLQVTDQNDKILIIYTRQNFRKNTKERNRERAAESRVYGCRCGCMCVLCVVNWELGKKTKKLATLEMEGGRRKNKKGSLFTHTKMSRFSRKGWGCWFPPINFLLFYFLMNDFFFSCTTITRDSYHSIHSKMGSHL